jgi:YbbR domain-containing protein
MSRPAGAVTATGIITPDTVSVLLDELAVKKLPILANINPKPAMGHTIVGDIHLVPDSVTVSGPKGIIENLEFVKTDDKVYPDLKFDFSTSVRLIQPVARLVELSIDQTEVFLSIQKISQREISGISVQLRNAPEKGNYNYYISPSTLAMVLEGGGELLANLTPDDIVAYIDYRRIRDNLGGEHPPTVLTPSGLSYRDLNPKTVKLVHERAQF